MNTRSTFLLTIIAVFLGAVCLTPAVASTDEPPAAALGHPGSHEAWVSAGAVDQDQGEVPYDPPLIRPWPLEVSPPASVVQGLFESVQVNVDANGNNIRNDAANEPSIAIDPTNPDKMVIGWRQFDSIQSSFRQAGWGYSHDAGRTWTFPGVLTPGVFRSDPVLDSDADGDFYFYSLEEDMTCDLFRSRDGGVSWTGPFYALGGDKTWMAIDRTDGMGRGNVYAAWGSSFIRSIDGGLTFHRGGSATTMWGTLTVGPDGDVYTVARATPGAPVSRSRNAQDPNQTPTFERLTTANMGGRYVAFRNGSPSPGGLIGQPWIKVDHSPGPRHGNLYILESVDPTGADPLDIMFVRSSDDGQTWSDPVRINDDPIQTNAWQWFGAMSVAPNSGRIDATWFDTRNTGVARQSEMFYSYSTDGGVNWSENTSVTPVFDSWVGFPRQNKIGDYGEMISDQLGAMVTYSATFNDEQDVWFLRIDIDCNSNGFHDGDDIASGRSKDVNGNGIPDECELTCDLIRKFKVKCRNTKLKVKVKSKMVEGIELTINNNGDQRVITLDHKGNGKVKWRNQTGVHTVRIVECPEFEEVVDCG